jgi:ABC-2 type transport system ATP-binding protein
LPILLAFLIKNEANAMTSTETVIQAIDFTKFYDVILAVDHVNFEVNKGEIFGFIGPNGAGKTTTIKMLTTLLPPTSGTARIADYDVVRHSHMVRHLIGYVPQMLSADSSLTGYENLLLFAKLYDIPARERKRRIKDVLEIVGLSKFSSKLVRDYSGGMIRRLEVAQSILHRPLVLFLDEPTIGLDPMARHVVWDQIEKFKDSGTTIFLSTNYMDEAERLCDRIAIIHKGKIVAMGTSSNLKSSLNSTSLDEVFENYTGPSEKGEGYLETSRTRRTARRLG